MTGSLETNLIVAVMAIFIVGSIAVTIATTESLGSGVARPLVIMAAFFGVVNLANSANVQDFTVTQPQQGAGAVLEWDVRGLRKLTCVLEFGDGQQKRIDDCGGIEGLVYRYPKPGDYLVTLNVYRQNTFDSGDVLKPKDVATGAVSVSGG